MTAYMSFDISENGELQHSNPEIVTEADRDVVSDNRWESHLGSRNRFPRMLQYQTYEGERYYLILSVIWKHFEAVKAQEFWPMRKLLELAFHELSIKAKHDLYSVRPRTSIRVER